MNNILSVYDGSWQEPGRTLLLVDCMMGGGSGFCLVTITVSLGLSQAWALHLNTANRHGWVGAPG